jgi:hypothetical protein
MIFDSQNSMYKEISSFITTKMIIQQCFDYLVNFQLLSTLSFNFVDIYVYQSIICELYTFEE